MNNKCNQGCGWQNGFVPVSGNWDFNMDSGCTRQRQSRCNACETAEAAVTARQKSRCNDCETAEAADTAYQRKNRCNDCENTRQRTAREDVCSACGRTRNACTCGQENDTREAAYSGCGKNRNTCSCEQTTYTAYEACEAEADTPACVMKTAESTRGRQKGMGIVRGTMQNLNDIFDNARALKAGTLFPELHKPMNGYCPCGKECGTDCQQAAFAAWELRLYLNTHPDDDQARALLQQLIGDCCEPNYATTFLTEECGRWAWTDDPWPWNIEANCCK